MLEGSGIWERGRPRRARLRAALRLHPPRRDGRGADLVTDWYVWVFFFDDHFLEIFKRTPDRDGGKAYLDRLPLFMPMDLGTRHARADQPGRGRARRPVGAHRADACRRTGGARFAESTEQPAGRVAVGAGQHQRGPGRQPDRVHRDAPQGRRRALVGRTWSSTRRAPRCPAAIAATRPMRVLRDTFSDGVHLRNDLFSYQREVEEEGELTNGVLVLETLPRLRHPGGRRRGQRPADLAAAAVREHRAHRGRPRCSLEHGARPAEPAPTSLAYVKGLQDWQSGGHEWHMRSSRYMNERRRATAAAAAGGSAGLGCCPRGLGTSAAGPDGRSPGASRATGCAAITHVPFQPVGPLAAARLLHAVRRRAQPAPGRRARDTSWSGRGGWASSSRSRACPAPASGTSDKLVGFDFPLCAAGIHPDATPEELDLSLGLARLGHLRRRLLPARSSAAPATWPARSCRPTGCRCSCRWTATRCRPSRSNALERGLADLWQRTAGPMAPRRAPAFRAADRGR